MPKKVTRDITCREAGRRGGRARARKHSKAELSAWARQARLGMRKVSDVQSLIEDRQRGLTLAEIGRRHGVDASTVCRYLRRSRGPDYPSQPMAHPN